MKAKFEETDIMTDTQHTVKLAHEERGTGKPVVLVHGFPFDHTIWQAQIDVLSPDYRVITPDLRGHGLSPVPQAGYDLDAMMSDVIALLDSLGIDAAVWVGHSMGGYITMAALRHAPQRVSAAAFVASHPFADSPEKQQDRRRSADRALAEGSAPVVAGMINVLFAPGTDLESMAVKSIQKIMVNTPPVGVAGALIAMAGRPDSVKTLQDTHIPMTLIAGAQDQIVKPELVEPLAQHVPHLRLVQIDRAGHMPMIEQPEITAAALREFLRRA
jgi:3-oxoadipate enol-lactonase